MQLQTRVFIIGILIVLGIAFYECFSEILPDWPKSEKTLI